MPEVDELVIVRIKKIYPYGAFCELEEYGLEGFIHISEVAARWIKNIHTFLKEGQRTVARVYRIVPDKGIIDVSLRRVSEDEKRAKFEAHRRAKRARKLLEIASTSCGPEGVAEVEERLAAKFGDAWSALEEIAANESVLAKLELSESWKAGLSKIAKETIKRPIRRISGILTASICAPNGIDILKKALTSVDVRVHYIGAPKYMIIAEHEDWKKCEKKLNAAVEQIIAQIKAAGGECKFERKE